MSLASAPGFVTTVRRSPERSLSSVTSVMFVSWPLSSASLICWPIFSGLVWGGRLVKVRVVRSLALPVFSIVPVVTLARQRIGPEPVSRYCARPVSLTMSQPVAKSGLRGCPFSKESQISERLCEGNLQA